MLTKAEVSQLYVAIFNRASEGEGNAYWQKQGSISSVANQMLATSDAKGYFGTSLNTNQSFIEHIYKNTLNKTYTEDKSGIDYWVAQLNNGSSRGDVVASLINAIGSYAPGGSNYNATDTKTVTAYNQFNNRVSVSDYMMISLLYIMVNHAILKVLHHHPMIGFSVMNSFLININSYCQIRIIPIIRIVHCFTIR